MLKLLPTILIVDDTIENLLFLEVVIRKLGVNLIKALSGPEALEKIKDVELALAILDVRMPGMTGYELAQMMNTVRAGEKVPVIFLTANSFDEREMSKGYSYGAVDYIFKPVDRQILISKINVFIDLYNQKQTIVQNAGLLKDYADKLNIVNSALKESEEKYKSYIDNAPDGVFVADETGRYIEVNEAACRITGYSKDELLGMSISDILSEESLNEGLAGFKNLITAGTFKSDVLFKHKDGSQRWWSIEAVKLTETRFLGFTKDITERRQAEAELKNSLEQLHQLTQHIEKVRENERIAISRELHDDLGQALTAVKIDLGLIKQKVSDLEAIARINKVSALVSNTIKTVQRLTSQLRPQILDDLGLEAAIEWHAKEFEERYGVEVILDLDIDAIISPEASLIVFRIMQESLTNIGRHSRATHVEIKLCKTSDSINFSISDNGIGINEDDVNSKSSFGLIGMKERAASLSGTFNVYKKNDNGTVVMVIFPIKNQ